MSSRILGAAPLLFKAYRLDLVGSGRCELLSVEGQLDWVLKAFYDNSSPGESQQYLPTLLQVERLHHDLREVYSVLLSDPGFDCQTQGRSPDKTTADRPLRITESAARTPTIFSRGMNCPSYIKIIKI